ncbi:M48 family metalloprotease [candidate division WOR-3 bacterium]|uniref:Protease HtpX homolog n=1 Tax=candidate division WOR-3 bacterium TaxID=2052148 RepID=A0A9D5QDB4_UNCW3|nr:M48 family metalloprotease [candidate division WOR-3 bacterium]MBD3365578.1 M48 family metalloprotease [candidate division WOR-3 bacterium]
MKPRRHLYNLIAANKWKTFFFVLLFALIIGFIGLVVVFLFTETWTGFIIWCIVIGLFLVGYNLIFFFTSKKLALAANGAKKANPDQYKRLHNVVEEMSIASGLPKPEVYIVHDPAPNAFATGRNPKNAAVAVTTGLYEMMDRAELQGVIAHEMSHIKNHDILLMTIIAIMVGAVVLGRDVMLRWGLFFGGGRSRSSGKGSGAAAIIRLLVIVVLLALASIAVLLIRAAISRQREYLADASGAMMTRNPEGLARALEKIGGTYRKIQRKTLATAHLYISSPECKDRLNPKRPHKKIRSNAWSTHPPIGLRVERLRQLDPTSEYAQRLAWARADNAPISSSFTSRASESANPVEGVTGGVTGMGLVAGTRKSEEGPAEQESGPPAAKQGDPQQDPPVDTDESKVERMIDDYFIES